MNYVIRKRCAQKITSFYRNVSKKYKHTYSLELMEKNVNDAYDSMFQIESTLMRRQPNIIRWKGYHMANTDNGISPIPSTAKPLPLWMPAMPKTCIINNVCRQANKIRDICAICVRLNEDCTYRTGFFGNKSEVFGSKSYINLSLIFATPYLRLRRSITGGLSLLDGRFLFLMKK